MKQEEEEEHFLSVKKLIADTYNPSQLPLSQMKVGRHEGFRDPCKKSDSLREGMFRMQYEKLCMYTHM